jgi:hypothetical protein
MTSKHGGLLLLLLLLLLLTRPAAWEVGLPWQPHGPGW